MTIQPLQDPIVIDDGESTVSLSELHASWSSSDDESGITEYRYAISTDPTDPDTGNIVPWTSTGTDAQVTATGLTLTNGTTYYFHVMAKNGAGQWSTVGHSDGITVNIPTLISETSKTTQPSACYPNPFQSGIRIKYQLGSESEVTIKIYNSFGRVVSTLEPGRQSAGDQEVPWDGTNVAPGIYYVQIQAGNNTFSTVKVVKK